MITRKGRSGHKTILREKLAIGDPEKKSTEQTWVVKECKNHRPTLKKILWIGPLGLKGLAVQIKGSVDHFHGLIRPIFTRVKVGSPHIN